MDLLYVKRVTGLYPVELAEILGADVPLVEMWMVDFSTMPTAAWDDMYQMFEEATLTLDAQGFTWDQVKSLRQVSRLLFVTSGTLDTLLSQRKIKPLDFGVLGQWLTDEQVQACRKLP